MLRELGAWRMGRYICVWEWEEYVVVERRSRKNACVVGIRRKGEGLCMFIKGRRKGERHIVVRSEGGCLGECVFMELEVGKVLYGGKEEEGRGASTTSVMMCMMDDHMRRSTHR